MNICTDINRADFNINTLEGKREFLRNLITYYVICEGIFFFSGFAMLLSFNRQNKLPGVGEQIQYTLRDESLHIKFGIKLINRIREDDPKIWTKAFEKETIEHIDKAMELELDYARDVLPNGILGLNSEMFIDYVQYIANRRLESLNLPSQYEDTKNPFPWMSEIIDLEKCKNFFETRVTEYAVGNIEDDF
jgi:ribonucleoside-diphosphate reductase beta chain